MNNKKLLLFTLASMSSAVVLAAGWLIGSLLTRSPLAGFWAGFGGLLGALAGVEVGHRWRLINARWDRILWAGPMLGYVSVGGLALYNDLPAPLIAALAVLGAGLGALLSKYMMEFFNYDPPPSIL